MNSYSARRKGVSPYIDKSMVCSTGHFFFTSTDSAHINTDVSNIKKPRQLTGFYIRNRMISFY